MMSGANEVSITACRPGQRTPQDQIRTRERAPVAGTVIRTMDRSVLHKKRRDERDEIMSVVMKQPHRVGVSAYPDDAWMATALGRFCRSRWNDKGTQKARYDDGERYAQLIDSERISRGEPPRQCAEIQTSGSAQTMEDALKKRIEAESAVQDAEDAMREVDGRAVRAVRELAWHDRDIAAELGGRAYNALYKLSVHFERMDKPRR
jgi:hypothetical protein